MVSPTVRVEPSTPERWDDLVALFGTRGDPAHCWCQFFRRPGVQWDLGDVAGNRSALESEVSGGDRAPGVLAYAGDLPVGWVAVAPRTGYGRLMASRALAAVTGDDLDDERVWSLTCFVVRVGWRRRGVSAALLAGAVDFARAQGARVLEAQPVDVAARAARPSGAELYHGVASTFLRAGFTEVGRTAPSRPVLRYPL